VDPENWTTGEVRVWPMREEGVKADAAQEAELFEQIGRLKAWVVGDFLGSVEAARCLRYKASTNVRSFS
jgi:hypothetical protein